MPWVQASQPHSHLRVVFTHLAKTAALSIDLLVMGVYGHSRIRQFLVGSTTTQMLRTTTSPLLLLR